MAEFNYEGLFAERAPITTRGANRHARYDFAVAYPDPDTLPLEGLVDALGYDRSTALIGHNAGAGVAPAATVQLQ